MFLKLLQPGVDSYACLLLEGTDEVSPLGTTFKIGGVSQSRYNESIWQLLNANSEICVRPIGRYKDFSLVPVAKA